MEISQWGTRWAYVRSGFCVIFLCATRVAYVESGFRVMFMCATRMAYVESGFGVNQPVCHTCSLRWNPTYDSGGDPT